MSRLVWDTAGHRQYETGVKNGALYVQGKNGVYGKGVVWDGLISVTESPSGAEPTALYADDIKYLNLMSVEEFGATIEAYMYPPEFEECDGSREIAPGVVIGQQDRSTFGLVYKTIVGNDIENNNFGYKIHIIYGAQASPSEKGYSTVNDSPDAITFSWEVSTTPVNVAGFKPTATLVVDGTRVDAIKLKELEDVLFGVDATEARLPLPDEIATLIGPFDGDGEDDPQG